MAKELKVLIIRPLEKIAGTVLFVFWLVKYQWKKFIEHYNSAGAGAHKLGKVVVLWPNFDPNFSDIWKVQKGYITYIDKGCS